MSKVQEAMASLLSILQSGNLEPVALAFFKDYSKPSDSWSFLNRMLMHLNETSDARGFRQWQSVNRYVVKGSKAFYILGPCKKKITDEESGEEGYMVCGFRSIPVFRFEDTDGEPLEGRDFDLSIPCQFDGIIQELGLSVRAVPFEGDWIGAYSQSSKQIILATSELEVFLHELTHAVDDRLHNIKNGQHKDQEIIASFGAAVIGRMLGYEVPLGHTLKYLKAYSELSEVTQFFNRIEAIVSFVLSRTAPQSFPPAQEALA
jgi:hypothetical protein